MDDEPLRIKKYDQFLFVKYIILYHSRFLCIIRFAAKKINQKNSRIRETSVTEFLDQNG